jgi:D-alanyl-D-alanine dipeptidase
MKNYFSVFIFIFFLFLFSCSHPKKDGCKSSELSNTDLLDSLENIMRIQKLDSIEKAKYSGLGLIDIQSINKDIFVDLKYAGKDNFMKMKLYEKLDKAFLQKEVATRLSACQIYLSKIDNSLHLLVYDAIRPLSVQQKMWDALDSIPVVLRTKFVSNPQNGSLHNYGAAVDVTICNQHGKTIDMGASYDDIREIAYPRLEKKFLLNGELTAEQVENRILLRKVMASQEFSNIDTEWWHFNACSRAVAKEKYVLLEEE